MTTALYRNGWEPKVGDHVVSDLGYGIVDAISGSMAFVYWDNGERVPQEWEEWQDVSEMDLLGYSVFGPAGTEPAPPPGRKT